MGLFYARCCRYRNSLLVSHFNSPVALPFRYDRNRRKRAHEPCFSGLSFFSMFQDDHPWAGLLLPQRDRHFVQNTNPLRQLFHGVLGGSISRSKNGGRNGQCGHRIGHIHNAANNTPLTRDAAASRLVPRCNQTLTRYLNAQLRTALL